MLWKQYAYMVIKNFNGNLNKQIYNTFESFEKVDLFDLRYKGSIKLFF